MDIKLLGLLLNLDKKTSNAIAEVMEMIGGGGGGTAAGPSGSYMGNGSSKTRNIDTGGTGNIIIVWSPYDVAIVTNKCFFGGIEGASSWGSSVQFANGVLQVNTSNSLNKSDREYFWRVV